MALGPGDIDSQLVSAAVAGEMKYTDFRMIGSQTSATTAGDVGGSGSGSGSARMGVWKTVVPEEKGPLTAFAAHLYAPLLSTASFSQQAQVVRVWGSKGDSLACRRGSASMRLGLVNAIAWHPYQLLFATGGGDAVVSICEVDSAGQQAATHQTTA